MTPFHAQHQKRAYDLNYFPKASGRSRHGEAVRAIQRTDSINSRLSRPLLPGSPPLPDTAAQSGSYLRVAQHQSPQG